MWVRISTAATSIVCSACIAASASLLAVGTTVAGSFLIAKTPITPTASTDPITALGGIAAFSALPAYRDLLTGAKNPVDALGGIAAFSALPAYRDLLTGAKDPADALGHIAAFSALPAYRDLLDPASAGQSTTTSTTGTSSALASAAHGMTSSTTTPAASFTPVPNWSRAGSNASDSGSASTPGTAASARNEDLTGSEQGKLPNPLKSIVSGGSEGGTSQQDNTSIRSSGRDVTGATADQQTTGKSGTGSWSRKFAPNSTVIIDSGSRGSKQGMRGWPSFGKSGGTSSSARP